MPAVNARPNRLLAQAAKRIASRRSSRTDDGDRRSIQAALASTDGNLQLTASMVLSLQRLAGNDAVTHLLGTRRASLQRANVGWSGAQEDSWNKGAVTVTAEGKRAKPGEEGIVRIPVSGIAAGPTGGVRGETGGGSDPNIGARLWALNQAAKKKAAKEGKPAPPPIKELAVSDVTTETAGGESGGEAIVIVPAGLPSGPVDVLLHLHGHTIGYREVKGGKGAAPPPRDVQYDRVEQQLLAAAKEGLPMIGVLPQGSFYSKFGPNGEAGFDADAYINQVFSLGVPQLEGLKRGRVTLSGWSGAGNAITLMMGGSGIAPVPAGKAKASKKGRGAGTAARLPGGSLEGLFLFDAIYGSDQLSMVRGFLQTRLEADLAELHEKAGASRDPASAEQAQQTYLVTDGFRFRGIYTSEGGCVGAFHDLETYLKDKWWSSAAVKGLPALVGERLMANYQIQFSGAGVHHNEMIGKEGGADQENLLKAIEMLPKPAKAAAGGAHGRPSPIKTRTTSPAAPGRATRPVPVAAAAGSVDDALIAAAVALGRTGTGSTKPEGGTLLRQDDLRSALDNRGKNPAIAEGFRAAETAVAAVPEGPGRASAIGQQAAILVRALELQFILDPSRSAIDLLPADRAKHWKDFKWEKDDYPGGPKGTNEGQALKMMEEMTTVRAERRPNIGPAAVVTKKEMTPERWAYISQHARTVPGEEQGLFTEAGESFVRMRTAAKADGVHLRILSGYRDPVVAARRAKKAGNPYAVASFSSHSLGLAADLEMWGGKDRKGETNTAVMQKVFDMRATPVHKWMVLRGEEFHWYPYGNEPWHWEYNPPGLKDRFFKAEAKASTTPTPKPSTSTRAATPQAAADGKRLSGADWVREFATSKTIDDLKEPFKGNLSRFIDMLQDNKANVEISATYRPPERAWLMHWAWVIAKGGIKYSRLGTIKNPHNVKIAWDHGSEADSRAAAAEMVSAYQMAHIAALQSRHTERRAVDMTITRLPKTLLVDGEQYPIGKQKASANEALWMVGQMFKVIKLDSDPPHWSDDGH
jgi:hypothetical protein